MFKFLIFLKKLIFRGIQQDIDSGRLLGKELILDLYDCDKAKLDEETLEQFLYDLCRYIDMTSVQLHKWNYTEQDPNIPKSASDFEHLAGWSMVLFLVTSNITLHSFTNQGKISLNVYSCKDYSEEKATEFCKNYFNGKVKQSKCILRF